MLLESIVVGTTINQILQSLDMNEAALRTSRQAHNTHVDTLEDLRRHKESANKRLEKLVNRKKALLKGRIPQFITLYQRIQKINFRPGEGVLELAQNIFTVQNLNELNVMATTSLRPMSEKELAGSFLLSGLGGMILADSKRNVQIADSQLKIASTLKTQAETAEIAIDAIGARADQISEILQKLGFFLGRSIQAAEEIIQKNGTDRSHYSKADREVLMNCLNLAKGVKDILDVPILGQDGSVTQESTRALEAAAEQIKELDEKVR